MTTFSPWRALTLLLGVLMIVSCVEAGRIIVVLKLTPSDSLVSRWGNAYALRVERAKDAFCIGTPGCFSKYGVGYPSADRLRVANVLQTVRVPRERSGTLIIGDSFMTGQLGIDLEQSLLDAEMGAVHREAVFGGGLANPYIVDWYQNISELLQQYEPETLIVMLGFNDRDAIERPGSEEAYAGTVKAFLDRVAAHHTRLIWIGLPQMKVASQTEQAAEVNSIIAQAMKSYPNASFLSTWDLLAVDGAYSDYLPDAEGFKRLARTPDGIHVTPFGAHIIIEAFSSLLIPAKNQTQ